MVRPTIGETTYIEESKSMTSIEELDRPTSHFPTELLQETSSLRSTIAPLNESEGYIETILTVDIYDKGLSVETEEDFEFLHAIVLSYEDPRVIKIRIDAQRSYIAHSEVIKYLILTCGCS